MGVYRREYEGPTPRRLTSFLPPFTPIYPSHPLVRSERDASADAVVAGGSGGGEPAPEVDESKPTTTLQVGVMMIGAWHGWWLAG